MMRCDPKSLLEARNVRPSRASRVFALANFKRCSSELPCDQHDFNGVGNLLYMDVIVESRIAFILVLPFVRFNLKCLPSFCQDYISLSPQQKFQNKQTSRQTRK